MSMIMILQIIQSIFQTHNNEASDLYEVKIMFFCVWPNHWLLAQSTSLCPNISLCGATLPPAVTRAMWYCYLHIYWTRTGPDAVSPRVLQACAEQLSGSLNLTQEKVPPKRKLQTVLHRMSLVRLRQIHCNTGEPSFPQPSWDKHIKSATLRTKTRIKLYNTL